MKYAATLISLVAFSSGASALSERDLDNYIVKQGGRSIYPVEVPAASGMKAGSQVVRITKYGKTKIVEVKSERSARLGQGSILASCKEQWNDDAAMVEHCVNEQEAARSRLSGISVPEMCWSEWESDFKMVEHCANEQNAARNRIERR